MCKAIVVVSSDCYVAFYMEKKHGLYDDGSYNNHSYTYQYCPWTLRQKIGDKEYQKNYQKNLKRNYRIGLAFQGFRVIIPPLQLKCMFLRKGRCEDVHCNLYYGTRVYAYQRRYRL